MHEIHQDNTEELALQKAILEEQLEQAGIYVPALQRQLTRGTGALTDIPETVDYFRLLSQLAHVPTVELSLTEDASTQDLFGATIQQLTGKPASILDEPNEASFQFGRNLQNIPQFNLIISAAPSLSEGIEERNEAIRSFSDSARSFVQYRGTRLVVYSENLRSVPYGLVNNLPSFNRHTTNALGNRSRTS